MIRRLSRHIIKQTMIEYAQAARAPRQFIEGITAGYTKGGDVVFSNTWKRKDKYGEVDLADIFENGSTDHDITPRFERALRYVEYYPPAYVDSDFRFTKKVHVSGIPALHAMANGWRTGKRRVQSAVRRELTLDQWRAQHDPTRVGRRYRGDRNEPNLRWKGQTAYEAAEDMEDVFP